MNFGDPLLRPLCSDGCMADETNFELFDETNFGVPDETNFTVPDETNFGVGSFFQTAK